MTPTRAFSPAQTVSDVLARTDAAARSGRSYVPPAVTTGFWPLDDYLGGGLRGGELTLLGGAQGLGKTVLALQIARNVVAAGGQATFVSYEHDVDQLLERLLCLEGSLANPAEAPTLVEVRTEIGRRSPGRSLADRLGSCGASAVAAVASYGERFRLVQASGARTGIPELQSLVPIASDGSPALLVVDYLQKVCASHVAGGEDERVTYVVEALKDLALDSRSPVLAVVAADKQGLGMARTRLHHLRGSSALAYEADVALLLNDKFDVLARHHLMYGTTDSAEYRQWVVCSIEKNRGGVSDIHLELRKHFAHSHFDQEGRLLREVLADERLGYE